MGSKLSEQELRAWQALLHAHHAVTTKLDAELRTEHSLSLGDYDVLLRLVNAPDRCLRMSELAERVMVPPSTLTRRMDRLVADGLVVRKRFEGDSRVQLACLTKPGRRALRRAAQTHLRGIREHYTGRLSAAQLGQVASGLEAISGRHVPH